MFIMKESEVDWIKRIPTHWNTNKCKYISLFINGYSFDSKKLISDYIFPVIRIGDINGGKINYSSILGVKSNNGLQQYKTQPNDILLAMSGATVGKIGLVNIDDKASYINQRVGIIRSKFSKYLFYCLSTNSFIEYILLNALGSAQPNVSTNIFNNFKIPFPSLIEQHKIADFLDRKCSEIDALTADIQTQIETLEEYKKSVITEAVTKGLDPNVEMKDSHCFYVGLINKNWDTTKIGYFCKKMYHPVDENLIPLICSNKGKVEIRDNSLVGRMVSENHAMQGIRQGEIAIHGMDTWHGAIGISTFDGNITRVVHVCQSTGDNRFVVYYLQSLAFRNVYKLISNGIRGNTSDFRSWELVKKIVVPHPSKTEQSQIADFLDQKCSEIDQTISEKQQQLETLVEYKKSLIYEYVTGKKEVA